MHCYLWREHIGLARLRQGVQSIDSNPLAPTHLDMEHGPISQPRPSADVLSGTFAPVCCVADTLRAAAFTHLVVSDVKTGVEVRFVAPSSHIHPCPPCTAAAHTVRSCASQDRVRDAGRVIQRFWALSLPMARAVRDGVREVAVPSHGERRRSGDRAQLMRAVRAKSCERHRCISRVQY